MVAYVVKMLAPTPQEILYDVTPIILDNGTLVFRDLDAGLAVFAAAHGQWVSFRKDSEDEEGTRCQA